MQRMIQSEARDVSGIVKSPSETRPISCVGSKLKGILATSLNQSVSISSLLYSKVHMELIYVHSTGKDYFSKYKGFQAMRL